MAWEKVTCAFCGEHIHFWEPFVIIHYQMYHEQIWDEAKNIVRCRRFNNQKLLDFEKGKEKKK